MKSYEFAPRCEQFCGAMLGFAEELKQNNHFELAGKWEKRAVRAEQSQFFGGGIGISHTSLRSLCCT